MVVCQLSHVTRDLLIVKYNHLLGKRRCGKHILKKNVENEYSEASFNARKHLVKGKSETTF